MKTNIQTNEKQEVKKVDVQPQLKEYVNGMTSYRNHRYYLRPINILSSEAIEEAFRKTMMDGLPRGIYSGIDNLDQLCRLDRGKLVVVTGIPNMGKSEFIDDLCARYNMLHGMRTLYFSPENQPIALHISKLFAKFEGRKVSKEDIVNERSICIRDYIYKSFGFFNYGDEYHLADLLSIAEVEVYRNGIDILVIDSYNKVLHESVSNETEVIGRDLDLLERFAKRLNVIVILVAHPRKMEKDKVTGLSAIPSAYDINGSANFFNKADYVISNYPLKYTYE